MYKLLIFSLTCFPILCIGQSYKVETFQDDYEPLTNYSSLVIERIFEDTLPIISGYSKDFELGFDFPFFNESFSRITLFADGYGIFEGSQDYNTYLFAGDYEVLYVNDNPIVLDTPLVSDWRYSYEIEDNEKVLKVEWFNVGLSEDLDSDNPSNHHINFQIWLHEYGDIDVRFGEIDLSASSLFLPGQGFIFDGLPEIYGPWVALQSYSLQELIGVMGPFEDPNIVDAFSLLGVINTLPTSGDVIKFKRLESKATEIIQENLNTIAIYPNRTQSLANIMLPEELSGPFEIMLYDSYGSLLQKKTCEQNTVTLNLEGFASGVYYARLVLPTTKMSKIMKLIKY